MKIRFTLFLILFSTSSFAAEKYEFYNCVRCLGMGGARIAVVNDETALLVNPAALGKLRNYFVTIVDPEISVGSNSPTVVGVDASAFLNPQTLLNKSLEAPNKHFHQRVQFFPSLIFPNFGIGIYSKYETNSEYITADNNFRFDYTNDIAVVIGYNLKIWDGRIKIGFNGRAIDRTEAHQDIDPTSTQLTLNPLIQSGVGLGGDVGIILTAPWAWLPTLSAVYRDVGNTQYNIQNGLFGATTSTPAPTTASLDGAIALFPILSKNWRAQFSLEYRDILNPDMILDDQQDALRKAHSGLEFNFSDAIFIRTGWHQHYWTAGFEVAMRGVQFQAATWGEEIGTATTRREDRRYVIKFAYRF